MFKIATYLGNFLTFSLCVLYFGFQTGILTDYQILIVIILGAILKNAYSLLGLHIYKVTKLSDLLPYGNLDKLFIIIFGFFLYQGIEGKQTSLTTLAITFLTICIITIFTVDFKNIKVPKTIILYIFQRLFSAILTLITGYILLSYEPITFGLMNTLFKGGLLLLFIWYIKDSLTALLKQSRGFYKHRGLAIGLGQFSMVISLFIIESAGIIIASLLGFISVAFSIISMKVTLNDSPSKKQIILAFIVIGMIGLGYYFK